jgi:hypothetical protein
MQVKTKMWKDQHLRNAVGAGQNKIEQWPEFAEQRWRGWTWKRAKSWICWTSLMQMKMKTCEVRYLWNIVDAGEIGSCNDRNLLNIIDANEIENEEGPKNVGHCWCRWKWKRAEADICGTSLVQVKIIMCKDWKMRRSSRRKCALAGKSGTSLVWMKIKTYKDQRLQGIVRAGQDGIVQRPENVGHCWHRWKWKRDKTGNGRASTMQTQNENARRPVFAERRRYE